MPEPRTVVIGYGFAGRSFHSYLIGLDTGLKLHGVCSRSPETRQKIIDERGCKAYESFEQVLSDDAVDLVVLATPNAVHADQAVQALNAGKHVVTDKVMATTLEDCDRMIAAANASGKLLSVFQNRRWDGDYLTVRKLLDEGRLGELYRTEMWWGGFGAWKGWRGQKAMGGGKLYDLGAHLLDQTCLLFPQAIESVYARLDYLHEGSDVESDATVMVNFTDGGMGIAHTSSITAMPKPRFYVCGSNGTFQKFGLDPQEDAMKAGDIDSAVESPDNFGTFSDGKNREVIPTLAGRWRNFYENVARAIHGEAELAVKPETVRRSIAVLDAAFRSSESGQAVKVSLPAMS